MESDSSMNRNMIPKVRMIDANPGSSAKCVHIEYSVESAPYNQPHTLAHNTPYKTVQPKNHSTEFDVSHSHFCIQTYEPCQCFVITSRDEVL